MASKCRKFVPNMFNKSKCQACFGSKEAHSAAALENNKATRKVCKCGYLFVAPDFDFSNPLNRTRRWQRRFFRLYDDGELTYCVDDHADTVPQGSVDMNKCTEILDAEATTTHSNSIAVVTPEKTEYFKADSKEEIQWWHDVLVVYPNQLKSSKTRRKPNFIINNKENIQPNEDDGNIKEQLNQERFDAEKIKQQGKADLPAFATFKGVRSLKHKYDKNHQEGMRKSSSLHDLSSEDKDMAATLASSRFLSCSGDRLDVLSSSRGGRNKTSGSFPPNPYFNIPRTSWPSRVHPTGPVLTAPAAHPSLFNSSSSLSSTSSTNSATRQEPLSDRPLTGQKSSIGMERSRHSQERSTGSKDSLTQLTLPRESGSQVNVERRNLPSAGFLHSERDDLSQSMSADETDSNETDELKMARSSELSASSKAHPLPSPSPNPEASPTKYEDLVYMKKGWLTKQGPSDRESQKHWFVLAGNSLRYYKDAKAEESNNLDGRIDLSTCYEVSEISTHRNYGFKIKTRNGEYILAAMTSGIRSNWMKAIRLCMDLHSPTSKLSLATSLTGKALASLSMRTLDDSDVRGGVNGSGASDSTTSTAVVTSAKGETAFQLVGKRDPGRKETRNVRRHHSDVNPGNVSTLFSLKEFSSNFDMVDSLSSNGSSSTGTGQKMLTSTPKNLESEKVDSLPRASKIPRHHSPSSKSPIWSQTSGWPLKRFVEGSDTVVTAPVLQGAENRPSKRNITSESGKEEEKRELMRRAKSPSARVKEKSRGAKTPRLHSPPPEDDANDCHRSSGSGQCHSDSETDLDMTISSEEHYMPNREGDDHDEIKSDSMTDGSMMVEFLESEVESLKERLDLTQSQLTQMHEANMDLKIRLQKETSQSLDGSYNSGRWSQQSSQQMDQTQTLKRQQKEAKDIVQKQCVEIESLKSKLDMSVSKLTGTEKALSDALKECKQEKDKLLKLSSEWNRRIRALEGQLKESNFKFERTKETLLTKERECQHLETETKLHQQKTREQDREILKLRAVEHEYNQLKERLDNKDRELSKVQAELKEKDSQLNKLKSDFEEQIGDIEREFGRERDDLENHLEELKNQLCSAQEQQSALHNSMTSNIADLLGEKDDIISHLEEKLIEQDRKMVDLQEELQAEVSENSDLMQNIENMQDEKQQMQGHIESLEKNVLSLKTKVADYEKDTKLLRQQLDKLQQEKNSISAHLNKASAFSDPEKMELERTILDQNKQIQSLQLKLMEKLGDLEQSKSVGLEQDDLLHNILILGSDFKEVNKLLEQLHSHFDAYLVSVSGETKKAASSLAAMVDEVGCRCRLLQERLLENSQGLSLDSSGGNYQHKLKVTTSSGSAQILDEYRQLKGKFDCVVAELKKLKTEVNEMCNSTDRLKKEKKDLQEKIKTMEGSCRQEIECLVKRLDQLSEQLAIHKRPGTMQTRQQQTTAEPVKTDVLLNQLDSGISSLEKALAEVPANMVGSDTSLKTSETAKKNLTAVTKLENASKVVKDVIKDLTRCSSASSGSSGHHQSLVSRLDSCGHKLDGLTHGIQGEETSNLDKRSLCHSVEGSSIPHGCPDFIDTPVSGMTWCMQEISERLQEIGEQLEYLEDEEEDSDEEKGGDSTNVEDVRDRLANLCEFVKQHSKLSTYDWHLMQLLMAQKAVVSKDRLETASSFSDHNKNKLQAYADRLSLEALVLIEMSHLLENKDLKGGAEKERDLVSCEISSLNSSLLSLHQKLENEMRTLCLKGASADVLRVQADIMAEKIMLESQLCCSVNSRSSQLRKEQLSDVAEVKVQPKLLAAEAIMRSQLDAYIGQNLDKTSEELWSSASHLTLRCLVQGELTFALNNLKKRITENPHMTESVGSVRNFWFERLKERHKAVMDVAGVYKRKMIQVLAIIISKDSEEMTIIEGPENVLDAVCSEVSTIMETHIQHYKGKVRTAGNSQIALQWDMIVHQLRTDRELVMSGIRQQHAAHTSDPVSESNEEVPFQSLDSSVSNFGEIMSLCSVLSAHLNFIEKLLKAGDTVLLVEAEEEEQEEGEGLDHKALQKDLDSFLHDLAEALRSHAQCLQFQLNEKHTDPDISAADIPCVPHPLNASHYNDTLIREAVFAAQTTFTMFKLQMLHEQDLASRPIRSKKQLSSEGGQEGDSDIYQVLMPLEEVLDTKYDDEMETLRVIASQVGKLDGVVKGRDWLKVEEYVRQLEQKVQDELALAQNRHEVHVDLFKQEENKVEHAWEESQQEREHFEERCTALEAELRSMTNQHEDEVQRMRQDVLTAVSAIRANEEESELQLSDKVQVLTKQLLMQKDKHKRLVSRLKSQLTSGDKHRDKELLLELLNIELKDIGDTAELPDEEELPPLPSHPPPDIPNAESSAINELQLLKKEKDEALAEETRNTKAALDAMRKAYEEELQHERDKYRECLTTMYNEDFVSEIRRRHELEMEKIQEELKQVKMHYVSKCEDLKLIEVKLDQTKQDYESHINQLIMSNEHLDDMVNQEIERLKDFIKNRPSNLTTGTATMEEELYDAQIMIRVKDAELQKLRSQVKNLDHCLHRTTEEQRQTMTQYLQALKENQELRKEYQSETNTLREQLGKAHHDKRPIRRTPSFHQRARSPSPTMVSSQRCDSTEHVSRESNRRRRNDPKDLRRSKSSPSLPYIFDAKSITTSVKSASKGGNRLLGKT